MADYLPGRLADNQILSGALLYYATGVRESNIQQLVHYQAANKIGSLFQGHYWR